MRIVTNTGLNATTRAAAAELHGLTARKRRDRNGHGSVRRLTFSTMNRSTFHDRLLTGYYTVPSEKHGEIRIHPEWWHTLLTGTSEIMVDERLNFIDFDAIIKWLDDSRIMYRMAKGCCRFDDGSQAWKRFIYISNENFENADMLR